MATQSYPNHAHRPTPTVVATFFLVVSIVGFALRSPDAGAWPSRTMFIGLIGSIGALIYISRTYTVRLQDRIIRLEMRVRTTDLLDAEQKRLLAGLDRSRIAALRFASDAELPDLLQRAVRESLKPDDIKRSVKNWVPDLDRT